MPTTSFADKQTLIQAAWLNDINAHAFNESAPGTIYHDSLGLSHSPLVGGLISDLNVRDALRSLDAAISSGHFYNNTRSLTSASGVEVVTGVGFAPSKLIVISGSPNPTLANWWSIGLVLRIETSSIQLALSSSDATTPGTATIVQSFALYLNQSTAVYSANIIDFTNDGYTINWLRTGATTGTARTIILAYP